MTKKELKQYSALLQEIAGLEQERLNLEDGCLQGVIINGMPKGKGGVKDLVGELAAKLEALDTLLAAKQQEAVDLRLAIEENIAGLKSNQRVLMRARYIEGKNWEQVAKEMNYSIRHILRVHDEVMQKMALNVT